VFAVDVLQLAVMVRDISMESLCVIGRMYCFVLHFPLLLITVCRDAQFLQHDDIT